MRDLEQQRVQAFRDDWMYAKGSGKGEGQTFWNALLGEVLGVPDLKEAIQYPISPAGLGESEIVARLFERYRKLCLGEKGDGK